MIVDSMKLASAAFAACRTLQEQRMAWLDAAADALALTEQSGAVRVSLELQPGPLLRRHLSGPPGRRLDGPWSEQERHILTLMQLGIAQLRVFEASGEGRFVSQVGALMAPLPGALRGGRRRFDPRIFRQHVRQLALPWDRLLPEFQLLLRANLATRQPLPSRR